MKRLLAMFLCCSMALSVVPPMPLMAAGNGMESEILNAVPKIGGADVNLALNKNAVASTTQDGNTPTSEAFDGIHGDKENRWASAAGRDGSGIDETWIYVDLGSVQKVSRFSLDWESRPNKFKMQVSNDLNEWTDVTDVIDNGFLEAPDAAFPANKAKNDIVLEEPVEARYVKMQGIQRRRRLDSAGGATNNTGYSLYEFEVYGPEWGDEDFVNEYVEKLTVPETVKKNFKLDVSDAEYGVTIQWTSSSDAITVDENGNAVVTRTDKDQEVVLTAAVTRGTVTKEKAFTVIVRNSSGTEYDIYPVPQSVEYDGTKLQLSETVNVVAEDGIEQFVKDYVTEVFETNGLNCVFGTELDAEKTNLVLGIKNGAGADETLLPETDYDAEASVNKNDGYVLDVNADENTITIIAKDGSGVYFGLTTLKQVLNEAGDEVEDMLVEDYSDAQFRGIVEGFYGQWSHANRKDLMDYIGDYKMNTYIYGSKNDNYHNGGWRDPYPADKAAELKELVDVGHENNVDFVWTAHVGGHINMGDPADYDALTAKFDQLYDLGVRQFGLFYDDASTDNTHLVEFLNRLNREYIHVKPGVKNLIMCPQYYNKSQGGTSYLKSLANLDEDIEVMWTGDGVGSPINNSVLDYIENLIQRPAYIWWNHPVNDLGRRPQMSMGKCVGLSPEVNALGGFTANPMLEAQASKVALFSVADYTWNIDGFDEAKSWENAFETLTDDAAVQEALKIFAENCAKTYQGIAAYSDESEYLIEPIAEIEELMRANGNYTDKALELKTAFEEMITAVETIREWNGNPGLVSEIDGWLTATTKVAEGGVKAMEALATVNSKETLTSEEIAQVYDLYFAGKAGAEYSNGKNVGTYRLRPFLKNALTRVELELARKFGLTDKQIAIASVSDDLADMLDGSKASAVTLKNALKADDYVGVSLQSVQKVDSVHVYFGADENDTANIPEGVLEYSVDGKEWAAIGEVTTAAEIEKDGLDITAQYIRFRVTKDGSGSTKIREFRVNYDGAEIYTNADNCAGMSLKESGSSYTLSGSEAVNLKPGAYVGIEVPKLNYFYGISADEALYANPSLQVEYSADEREWTAVTEDTRGTAKYLRVRNVSGTDAEVTISNLSLAVTKAVAPKSAAMSSNMAVWEGNVKNLIDGNYTNYLWTKGQAVGQYVEFTFEKESLVTDVRLTMDSADYIRDGIVQVYENGAWKDVTTFKGQQGVTNISFEEQTTDKVRIVVNSAPGKWLRINEVEFNKLSGASSLPSVSGISEFEARKLEDCDVTTSYNVPGTAGSIIYNTANNPQAAKLSVAKNDGTKITVEGDFGEGWVSLGDYTEAYNFIDFAQHGRAYQFRISWEAGSNVKFYELALSGVQKEAEKLYTVTVVNGNGTKEEHHPYNKKMTLTADKVESGKVFSGWSVDGKIVSTDEVYSFYVAGDVTVTAVYGEEQAEKAPEAMISNLIAAKRADGKYDIKFVAQLVIPEGYTLKNAGLVWSSKDGVKLELGGIAKTTFIKKISDTNQFSVTIKGMPADKFLRGRIFATLVNENGETVVYSVEKRAVNIALGKPVQSAKGNASFVTDGREDTYWEANGPESFTIDLQGNYKISSLLAKTHVGSRKYEFDIYVSADKETWTQLAHKAAGTPEGKENQILFTNGYHGEEPFRYVRVDMVKSSEDNVVRMREFEVFGIKLD